MISTPIPSTTVSTATRPAILAIVGFNPSRKFKAKPSDYLFVIAGGLVAVALVGWAFFG